MRLAKTISWISVSGGSDWKKYVTLSCITCISVLIVAGLINYSRDPSHLFGRGSYEQKVAEILSAGRNAAIVPNYEERLVQLQYINNLKSPNDVILLGSSRAMQIRSYHFQCRSFFNHAVSGASIEDFMAIYQMYLDKDFVPSKIVIALDPWILNRNNGKTRWQTIGEYCQTAVSTLNGSVKHESSLHLFHLNKWLNLISLGYLKASFESCLRSLLHHESQKEPFATMEDDLEVDVVRYDGSRSYNRSYRSMAHEKVKEDAIAYALGNPVYSLGEFRELDKIAIYYLETLVDDMLRRGIYVLFLFMPYHPETYQRLMSRKEYRILAEVESKLNTIAANKGIKTVGSYNPLAVGLSGKDFLDAMHPKELATNKIWQVYDVPKILR